jgi:hypothetical protein
LPRSTSSRSCRWTTAWLTLFHLSLLFTPSYNSPLPVSYSLPGISSAAQCLPLLLQMIDMDIDSRSFTSSTPLALTTSVYLLRDPGDRVGDVRKRAESLNQPASLSRLLHLVMSSEGSLPPDQIDDRALSTSPAFIGYRREECQPVDAQYVCLTANLFGNPRVSTES